MRRASCGCLGGMSVESPKRTRPRGEEVAARSSSVTSFPAKESSARSTGVHSARSPPCTSTERSSTGGSPSRAAMMRASPSPCPSNPSATRKRPPAGTKVVQRNVAGAASATDRCRTPPRGRWRPPVATSGVRRSPSLLRALLAVPSQFRRVVRSEHVTPRKSESRRCARLPRWARRWCAC